MRQEKRSFVMWLLNELKKHSNVESAAIIYRENDITYKDLWNKSEYLACFINSELKTNNPIVIYENNCFGKVPA